MSPEVGTEVSDIARRTDSSVRVRMRRLPKSGVSDADSPQRERRLQKLLIDDMT